MEKRKSVLTFQHYPLLLCPKMDSVVVLHNHVSLSVNLSIIIPVCLGLTPPSSHQLVANEIGSL